MARRLTPLVLAAGLLIGASALAAPAPEFTLSNAAGQAVSLTQLRGKVVYLDFWASWCGPCRQSFPWMNEMLSKYQAQGLEIVAVNLDTSRADAEKFLEKNPAAFSVVFDPTATLPPQYGVKGMPTSYLIDPSGEIILQHSGFNASHRESLEASIQQALESAR